MNSSSHNLSISAAELKQRLDNRELLHLLDVREQMEYHSFNIGGKNIAVNKLQQSLQSLSYHHKDEIIVICKVGKRSKTAQSILIENGYERVRNLEGGLIALQKIKSQ